jgi:hypothetical protein
MKTTHDRRCWALGSLACLASLSLFACKDDSPCDEGQEERLGAACYPINAGGTPGAAGTSALPVDAGLGLTDGPGVDAVIGQACADTTASSDCGGAAPICAPLPSGTVCTQILCLDGEPNAGVCPSDWMCLPSAGNPSVCLKL